MIRRRYLKTAVPVDEYTEICRRADAEGMTLAGYVRVAVARDADRHSVAETMTAIRAALPSSQAVAAESISRSIEPALEEVLQLMRLLAAQSNPQAAARITLTVKNQFAKGDYHAK